MKIIHECVDRLNVLCREFGLTPAARSRLQVGGEPVWDPDDVLNGK